MYELLGGYLNGVGMEVLYEDVAFDNEIWNVVLVGHPFVLKDGLLSFSTSIINQMKMWKVGEWVVYFSWFSNLIITSIDFLINTSYIKFIIK